MNIRFSEQDEAFRREIAGWLEAELSGEFAGIRGRGGSGDEHAVIDELPHRLNLGWGQTDPIRGRTLSRT